MSPETVLAPEKIFSNDWKISVSRGFGTCRGAAICSVCVDGGVLESLDVKKRSNHPNKNNQILIKSTRGMMRFTIRAW